MRTRFIALGCLVVFVIVLAVIAGAVLFAATLPPVSQQLPPDSAPLLVQLTTPLNSSEVPLDSPTSIQAAALGTSPIVSLELWIDGAPAETKAAPRADLRQFDAFWSWQPDAAGEHTLVARATDAAHHVVSSNVVRINATPAQAPAALVNYPTQPGDTLASIAQKSGASVEQIAVANPQMNPASPIGAGQMISVPHASNPPKTKSPTATPSPTASPAASSPTAPQATATPQAAPSGGSQPSSPFAGVSFWGKKFLLPDALLPAAPSLAASPSGCSAVLSIVNQAGNADGFFVYRTGAGNSQFTRIAPLGAGAKNQLISYTDPNVAGPLEYYVAAFNTAGESPSKIVSVNIVDSACALQFATNPLFKNGQVVPTQPVDKAYCYLSENSGAWSRVPPAPNTFILPTNGVFDVSAYLKTLVAGATSQMTMDLDCWGWKGSALAYLGEAKQTFTPQSNAPIQFAGDKFKFAGALSTIPKLKLLDPSSAPVIYPPTSLNSTADPSVCTSHGGALAGLFCEGAIANHYVVLAWEWDPNVLSQSPVVKDIEGYRVFENDVYYQHSPVASSTAGPNDKVAFFPLPAVSQFALAVALHGPDARRCFVVRAYKGALESSDSNSLCPGALPGVKTVVLNAAATKTVWNRYTNSCAPADPYSVYGSQLVVGYDFEDLSRDLTLGCGAHTNFVLRTLTRFDISQIGVVSRATLRYQLGGTSYGDNEDGHDHNRLQIPVTTYYNRSCAVELMLPTQDWAPGTNNHSEDNLVPAEDYIPLPTDGSDFAVDVTRAVSYWHSFGGNYGFELRGANEDTGSEENSTCRSEFGNFVLEVTFFPSSAPVPNLAPPGLNPAQP